MKQSHWVVARCKEERERTFALTCAQRRPLTSQNKTLAFYLDANFLPTKTGFIPSQNELIPNFLLNPKMENVSTDSFFSPLKPMKEKMEVHAKKEEWNPKGVHVLNRCLLLFDG